MRDSVRQTEPPVRKVRKRGVSDGRDPTAAERRVLSDSIEPRQERGCDARGRLTIPFRLRVETPHLMERRTGERK